MKKEDFQIIANIQWSRFIGIILVIIGIFTDKNILLTGIILLIISLFLYLFYKELYDEYGSFIFSNQKDVSYNKFSNVRLYPTTKLSNILYSKRAEKNYNVKPYKQIENEDKKDDEINLFFENLKKEEHRQITSHPKGAFLDESNYNLFYPFINSANKSLYILSWRIDERLLSELLWGLKDKSIKVIIITKNRTNKGYLNKFKDYCSNLDFELTHRNKIHAKLIIKDENEIAVGSSNITNASMSKGEHFLDCNTILDHKESVDDAINLFNSLYYKKDYMKKYETSKLLYSRIFESCLPFSLKKYFKEETEEIILLFSCDMVDNKIIDKIIEWNPKIPIKLYVGDYFGNSHLSKDNLRSMRWLYDTSISNYKNVQVIPVHSNIHSKLYLFKNQKISFISSQNLTISSWQSLLETGIIDDEKKDFDYLYDSIQSLKKSNLDKIEFEDLQEIDAPENLFSGTTTESFIGIPWDLGEANPSWKITRRKNQEYFQLIKKRSREETNKSHQETTKTNKIIKNPLLEKVSMKYLKIHSKTRYRNPYKGMISGNLSIGKIKIDLENQLKYFQNLRRLTKNKNEIKKYNEGIKFIKNKLKSIEDDTNKKSYDRKPIRPEVENLIKMWEESKKKK